MSAIINDTFPIGYYRTVAGVDDAIALRPRAPRPGALTQRMMGRRQLKASPHSERRHPRFCRYNSNDDTNTKTVARRIWKYSPMTPTCPCSGAAAQHATLRTTSNQDLLRSGHAVAVELSLHVSGLLFKDRSSCPWTTSW